MKNQIEHLIGRTSIQNKTVLANQTAAVFADQANERYAEVLGTPFLIAEMERVCADIIQPLLSSEQVSVGVHIDVRHIAATSVGAKYTISASLLEHRWGLFTFNVESQDLAGKTASGKIVRAIADLAKIQQRAALSHSDPEQI